MTQTRERRPTVFRTSWGFLGNSVMAAVIAVVLTRIIELFGLAIAGMIFGREPVLTNSAVEFRAAGSDLALLGGPITALLAGVTFLMLFPDAKDRSAGKLTVLWMSLFSFRIGFYEMIRFKFDPSSSMAEGLAGFEIPAGIDTIVAAAGGIGMLLVAIAAAPAFLGFNRHRSEVATPMERIRFVASIALVPGLVAPLAAVPFLLGGGGEGYLSTLPLIGLFTVITTIAARNMVHISLPETIEERGFSPGLAVAVAVVFLFARFLAPGVPIPPWDDALNITIRP